MLWVVSCASLCCHLNGNRKKFAPCPDQVTMGHHGDLQSCATLLASSRYLVNPPFTSPSAAGELKEFYESWVPSSAVGFGPANALARRMSCTPTWHHSRVESRGSSLLGAFGVLSLTSPERIPKNLGIFRKGWQPPSDDFLLTSFENLAQFLFSWDKGRGPSGPSDPNRTVLRCVSSLATDG